MVWGLLPPLQDERRHGACRGVICILVMAVSGSARATQASDDTCPQEGTLTGTDDGRSRGIGHRAHALLQRQGSSIERLRSESEVSATETLAQLVATRGAATQRVDTSHGVAQGAGMRSSVVRGRAAHAAARVERRHQHGHEPSPLGLPDPYPEDVNTVEVEPDTTTGPLPVATRLPPPAQPPTPTDLHLDTTSTTAGPTLRPLSSSATPPRKNPSGTESGENTVSATTAPALHGCVVTETWTDWSECQPRDDGMKEYARTRTRAILEATDGSDCPFFGEEVQHCLPAWSDVLLPE